jgi:hypothetical protein
VLKVLSEQRLLRTVPIFVNAACRDFEVFCKDAW